MRILRFFGLAAFALVAYAMPGAAQNIPPGSYQQTCRNIQVRGDHLNAECQTRDGNWRGTSLNDIDRCSGEITNDDGNLVCGRGNYGNGNGYGYGNGRRHHDNDNDADDRRGGWQGGYPPGDYVQTCRNIRMNGDHMDAQCQKKDGGWRNTSLDNVGQCGGIVNINGRLECGSGGGYGYNNGGYNNGGYYGNSRWNGGNPPGNYVQTCRNIQTNGNRLDAECQTRDGNWRRSSLNNLDRCTGDVANDNGHLVCGR